MNPTETANDAALLTALHEVLSLLAQDDMPEQVFAQATEKALLLTGASSAFITLLDTSRDVLTFSAATGENTEGVTGTQVHAADSLLGTTARTGEARLFYRPEKIATGTGDPLSAAVVPLFAGGVPVGALAALNKADRRPFDGTDLLTLSTLAKAASVALVGAKRRDDSRRQSRELGILYEAVRGIAGHLSVQEVLQAVIQQTTAHLPNSAVVVFLYGDDRNGLFLAEETGLTAEQRETILPAKDGVGKAILSAQRPLFLSFVSEEDQSTESPQPFSRSFASPFLDLPVRSGIGCALRSGDTTHGLLLVLSVQPPGAYTLADANLISALASQTANALDNALLFEDATRRAEEATTLYELSQTVSSTLESEAIPERVADAVISLLAVDKFALLIHDEASERLKMIASRGLADGAADRLQPAIGDGLPGWVMEFETPTAVSDVPGDHRNANATHPLQNEGVQSLACMPLQAGQRTIGVLCAMTTRRRFFTIAEMELLYTVANQAAIALENARIYADVREKGRELRKYFHRVARALGSAQSPRAVPLLIATLTLEIMGGDRCALYAVKEDSGERRLELVARHGFRLAYEPEGAGSASNLLETGKLEPVTIASTDDHPAGWVARRGRSLVVEDLAEDTRWDRALTRPARGKANSLVAVPLRSAGDIVGVLEMYTRKERRFRSEDLRLLLTFASQATVAFQAARLADERETAAREVETLRETISALQRQNELAQGG
ncbi:MAG: GAF domain-containing protein [Fibrella sp.]|nr:GAF domain-containing protein [Armatimonadota bacterium]